MFIFFNLYIIKDYKSPKYLFYSNLPFQTLHTAINANFRTFIHLYSILAPLYFADFALHPKSQFYRPRQISPHYLVQVQPKVQTFPNHHSPKRKGQRAKQGEAQAGRRQSTNQQNTKAKQLTQNHSIYHSLYQNTSNTTKTGFSLLKHIADIYHLHPKTAKLLRKHRFHVYICTIWK